MTNSFASLIRRVLIGLVASILVVPMFTMQAGATGLDLDGDGISDSTDIDDDGDGILDIDETVANFQWATFNTPVSGTSATGTIGSNGFTYTSSQNLITTSNMFNVGVFPSQYGVPSRNPTIRNDVASSNTLTFPSPVRNPLVAFSSIGNPSTPVPVQFDRPVEILWSQATVVNTSSRFTGSEGFVVLRVPGVHTSISFDYLADETYVNFAFGADPRAAVDSDSDGLDNSRDLDSDNDGIPDNIEAQTTAAYAAPSGTDSGGNGLDDSYESIPGAGEGLRPVDTDGDGTADVVDLDSDADTVNDVAEAGLGLVDANANGRADGAVGANGLDAAAESADSFADVNGLAHNGSAFQLADEDGDTAANGSDAAPRGQDLDYRDNRFDCDAGNASLDCDRDGIANGVDPHPAVATAVNDTGSARVGTTSTTDILVNDDFAAGSDTSLVRNGGTAGGTVTFDPANGTVSYRPLASEGGTTRTIGYRVCRVPTGPTCATATVTLAVAAASADLSVSATDPGPLAPGSSGNAVVAVANLGPSDAGAVTIVYTPPAGAVVVSGSLPLGCVIDVPAAGSVTCALGAIAASGAGSVSIPVSVVPSAVAGVSLTGGTVNVSSEAADPVGANSINRPAVVGVGAGRADLAIALVAAPTLRPAATGVIELTVQNLGPSTGGAFRVSYDLPLGVAFDSAGANPSGCTRTGITISCPVAGPLAVGASASVQIPIKMLRTQPTSGPIAPAQASITGRSIADPETGNDSVGATPVLDLSGDSDGDGLSDLDEMDPNGTGRPADSDGDGVPDYLDLPGVDVTGEVFRDLDRDGVADPGEATLSGVLVSLVTAGADGLFATSDDVVVATARTASPYRFANVGAGTYEVVIDPASLVRGMLPTGDVDGGTKTRIRVVVGSAPVTDRDFGANHPLISGVFLDDNGRPLGNVSIVVTDSTGATFRTTTAPDGSFSVEGTDANPIATGTATVSGRTADGVEVTRTIEIDGVVTRVQLAQQASDEPKELAFTGGSTASARAGFMALLAGLGFLALRRRRC